MARRSKPHSNPRIVFDELDRLLNEFSSNLETGEVRDKVIELIPAFHTLRDLGCSLLPGTRDFGARDRILSYFKKYPYVVIDGDELMVVSGIGEWARRLRELRVEYGWSIYSGNTIKELSKENAETMAEVYQRIGYDPEQLKPDQYVLISEVQDRDSAHRWNLLNTIRKTDLSVKEKILTYLRENVGIPVTGEELRYLAKNRSEWACRSRELRTEDGWAVLTKQSGKPDLPIGSYILEHLNQAEPHDRQIPDPVRVQVLIRDAFKCRNCGWSGDDIRPEDPRRYVELHHIQHHANRGSNNPNNLVTLCNVCHDSVHRDPSSIDYS